MYPQQATFNDCCRSRSTLSQGIVTLPIVRGAAPSNSTLKLARPGFGPALKRLGRTPASRCHVGCRSRVAVRQYARQPPRHEGFGTWALAVQLSAKAVRRAKVRREISDIDPKTRHETALSMPRESQRTSTPMFEYCPRTAVAAWDGI